MHWEDGLTLLGVHAEGEIGKVLMEGAPPIPGASVLEKLRYLNGEGDPLRRFCVLEPRGGPNLSVNLLLPPCEPGADAAFIVMQPDQCHAMSGSNAICVTTALLESGRVEMREPETVVVLDTAAGLVRPPEISRQGRCERVVLDMPESFLWRPDLDVRVPDLGTVRLDIAFGGVFYALLDPAALGLGISPASARRLVELGMRVLAAVQGQIVPEHPERPGLRGIAYLMFCGRDAEGLRNATIMPPGRIDRSPCGTGSSARLAAMAARGEVAPGERVTFRSIIGSRFEAEVAGIASAAGRKTVLPRISGRGWLYSVERIRRDARDPFPLGHALSDIWGPGLEN